MRVQATGIKKLVRIRNQHGASLVEYALLGALLAVAGIASIKGLGGRWKPNFLRLVIIFKELARLSRNATQVHQTLRIVNSIYVRYSRLIGESSAETGKKLLSTAANIMLPRYFAAECPQVPSISA